jgi:hypothetical protein
LKEKNKFGGYRCISLKVYDTKGGDFVENPELSMVVVESQNNSIVTEIGKEMPLSASPEGLHKKIEIGVNNYSPSIFLNQSFKVYFLKDSADYRQSSAQQDTLSQLMMSPISDMRSEQDILRERIEKDLVAFGDFSSDDLMSNSINPDDFMLLDN